MSEAAADEGQNQNDQQDGKHDVAPLSGADDATRELQCNMVANLGMRVSGAIPGKFALIFGVAISLTGRARGAHRWHGVIRVDSRHTSPRRRRSQQVPAGEEAEQRAIAQVWRDARCARGMQSWVR